MNATKNEPLTYVEGRSYGEPVTHRILVIEYQHNRPHSVVTDHGTFDFDYCKRDGILYFNCSGSGLFDGEDANYRVCGYSEPTPPPGKIWAAPGVNLYRSTYPQKPKTPLTAAALLSLGYVRLRKPLVLKKTCGGKSRNPFEAGEDSGGARMEYCSVCDDRFPDDSILCSHIYVPDCGEAVGTGSEEPSQESFFAALDWLALLKGWEDWCLWRRKLVTSNDLVSAIEKHILSAGKRIRVSRCDIENQLAETFAEDFDERLAELEDGIGWLTTLGPDTPEANAKTIRWIMDWRLSKGERAKTKERKAIIKELMSLVTDENRPQIIKALGITGKGKNELDGVPIERIREVLVGIRAR